MKRREFLGASLVAPLLASCGGNDAGVSPSPVATPSPEPPPSGSVVFHVGGVPDQPFTSAAPNRHAGVEALLNLMDRSGLKLYRTARSSALGLGTA